MKIAEMNTKSRKTPQYSDFKITVDLGRDASRDARSVKTLFDSRPSNMCTAKKASFINKHHCQRQNSYVQSPLRRFK